MDQEKLPGIRQFDLTGQVAIVTGGSKGLGAAMAAGLASAGASVGLAGRDGNLAAQVADEIASAWNGTASGVAADVTQPADVRSLVKETIKEFGR